jgi:hypothetical protein
VAVAPPPAASAPAATGAGTLTPIPESFEGGTKVDVENALAVSCETKALGEWLRFTCFTKTGTGGKPKRAVMPALGLPDEKLVAVEASDGGAPPPMREMLPEKSGMLLVDVPWKAGYKAQGFIEWEDTKYLLHVDGQSAKLAWDVTVQLRRTCAEVERSQKKVADDAVKAGTLTEAEAKKLPRFGRCQPAGFGSWAVGVTSLAKAESKPAAQPPGQPAEKQQFTTTEVKTIAPKAMLQAALEMIWVDFEGKTKRAPMGTVEFVADKLQLPRIVAYDYDGDGRDEAVVLYELNGFSGSGAPKVLAPIWSFDGTAVAAYTRSPGLLPGSLFTEQLDSDMRPDLGHFGPFVAWPTGKCGEAACPDRITGPKLFAHSHADGTFSLDDDAARAAGKRMCSSRPSPVVAGKTGIGRTALNVGCARLWGVSTEALTTELRAAAPALCGAEAECDVLKTLIAWSAIKPPFEIR